MSAPEVAHLPIVVEEASHYLSPRKSGRVVDGTLGGGGHTIALLQAHPTIEILAIDRDVAAVSAAQRRLSSYLPRVHFFRGSFADMATFAATLGWTQVDGVLLDLGLSSLQLDDGERGFSYQHDGPLDMRFDQSRSQTAADLLNTASVDELTRIFREYGEEPRAFRIATEVVARRAQQPWDRTRAFANLVSEFADYNPARRTQTLARCFQALRVAVNDELGHVERGLRAAVDLLAPGGRLVVITFHSLEDRLVKHLFRDLAASYVHAPEHPMGGYNITPVLELLTKHPVLPSAAEIARNRRAGSAKLRAAAKLPSPTAP